VGADVDMAFGPLNTVNFENRAHQEQLKGILEQVGTRELTGKDADQGLWARVQDAVAAFSGVVGSAVTQSSDKKDMNIQDLIRLDHNKVNTLFTELLQSDNPQKIQEYFGQIYKDLLAHSIAEEEVVYPRVRAFYPEDKVQELYSEQADFRTKLEEIKAIDPSNSQFKDKVKQLMDAVGDHIRQEEFDMFAAIRNNLSDGQSEQMASDFKAAKSKAQKEMGVVS
jgi:hemerythrin superfamily protein